MFVQSSDSPPRLMQRALCAFDIPVTERYASKSFWNHSEGVVWRIEILIDQADAQ
jgi:hypothetical protein